jgi:BirA family biotin operon repressor/biotin-[acetyl-CoA-carboxylase] ligase|tara:strand:- start:17 stop:559 length:543 start_codon:yes stop_codon:yes gene_type:complete
MITLLAGVAVADSIKKQLALPVELKWPNDVLIANQCAAADRRFLKVAGILAEGLPVEAGEGAVIGLGVNIGEYSFPPELANVATSLETVFGQPISRGDLCAEILVQLLKWRASVETLGSEQALSYWRDLSPSSYGVTVSWALQGIHCRGVTAGIDDSGALLVDCEGGRERIVGGELTWEL